MRISRQPDEEPVCGLLTHTCPPFVQAWARREALARERIASEGGEIEFGVYHQVLCRSAAYPCMYARLMSAHIVHNIRLLSFQGKYEEAGDAGDTMAVQKSAE